MNPASRPLAPAGWPGSRDRIARRATALVATAAARGVPHSTARACARTHRSRPRSPPATAHNTRSGPGPLHDHARPSRVHSRKHAHSRRAPRARRRRGSGGRGAGILLTLLDGFGGGVAVRARRARALKKLVGRGGALAALGERTARACPPPCDAEAVRGPPPCEAEAVRGPPPCDAEAVRGPPPCDAEATRGHRRATRRR